MDQAKPFVHLHVHSEFSRLDGMSKFEDIARKAAEDGAPAIAMTDHGTMAGTIQMIRAAKKHGLKYIPGLEAYHVPDVNEKLRNRGGDKNIFHLLLLAKSFTGYQNLMKLNSIGYMEHEFNGQSRVDYNLLAKHSEGIIATTGCLGSMVNQHLLKGDLPQAEVEAQRLVDIYGRDNVFVEIQDHGIPEQRRILQDQKKIADRLGLRLLATNDTHYTHEGDDKCHDAMLCVNSGSRLFDDNRFKFESDQHWLKTSAEMRELFPDDEYPGACDNTLLVADMVDIDIPSDGKTHYLPTFPLEGTGCDTEIELLRRSTYSGLREIYGDDDGKIPQHVEDRAEHELKVIEDMGFPGYFLVYADAIKAIKEKGHRVGPGRGSGAGSLVVYANGITSVDPFQFDLYFERFLNPGRVDSPPDIDIDIDEEGRRYLRSHLIKRYGSNRVAAIANNGYIKAKSAIKDAYRVSGLEASESAKVSGYMMGPPDMTLSDYLAKSKGDVKAEHQRAWSGAEQLRELYRYDSQAREAIDLARSLEGLLRNFGVHAGGIVISPGDLADYAPVRNDKDVDFPVSQYDKDDVEAAGLVKMDFLGLSNLNMLGACLRMIRRDLGVDLDLDNLPLDDKKTYKTIRDGDTSGVFQFEGDSMTQFLMELKPTKFGDLSAATALFRPGPMSTDAHYEYAARKNGQRKVSYFHPDAQPILEETFGLIVYQEQVMAISQKFAGFDAKGADDFRRAMGKKKAKDMAEQKELWLEGFERNGYGQALANEVWDIVEPFSGYAFNKSHSVAYSIVSYQTAYLKTHFRTQFVAATIETRPEDKIQSAIQSARKQGIEVYAPSVNSSRQGCRTSQEYIWLGLHGISYVNESIMHGIVHERETDGDFKSVADFMVRVAGYGINKKAVENLALCGAFDCFGVKRKQVYDQAGELVRLAKATNNAPEEEDIFGGFDEFGSDDDMLSETAIDVIDLKTGEEFSEDEKLEYEAAVIGFYASKHPFSIYEPAFERAIDNGHINSSAIPAGSELEVNKEVEVYGIVLDASSRTTKSGTTMSSFRLETGQGESTTIVLFGTVVDKAWNGKPVVVKGLVSVDTYKDDEIRVESRKIIPLEDLVSLSADTPRHRRSRERDEAPKPRASRRRTTERSDEPAEQPKRPSLRVVEGSGSPSPRPRPRSRQESRVSPDHPSVGAERRKKPVGTRTSSRLSKVYGGSDEPKSDGEQPYKFLVSNDESLVALSEILNTRYSKGTSPVVISYNGVDVSHPDMKFDLSLADIQDIEMETGAISLSSSDSE